MKCQSCLDAFDFSIPNVDLIFANNVAAVHCVSIQDSGQGMKVVVTHLQSQVLSK